MEEKMAKEKSYISRIEENAELLLQLDNHKHDRTITITEYNNNRDVIKREMKQENVEWSDFKKYFIDQQEELGFYWDSSQGYAGPVKLSAIKLKSDVGAEMASILHKQGVEKGKFETVLQEKMTKLYSYLGDDKKLLDIREAREEFKVPDSSTGYGFKFKQNSLTFERKMLEYKYISDKNPSRSETALGNLLLIPLKEELELAFVYHTQEEREGQKYKNIDIEGVQIVHTESEDFYQLYAFELKATNSIPAISEAISQAINYKSCSNYTYVIIPNFDFEHFYDEIRLREYLDMCRRNRIGVISVVMNEKKINELNILVEAQKTELTDYSRIMSLSKKEKFTYEKCHLCGKIVQKDSKDNCGWQVSVPGEERSHCMRILMSEMAEDFLGKRMDKVKEDTQK